MTTDDGSVSVSAAAALICWCPPGSWDRVDSKAESRDAYLAPEVHLRCEKRQRMGLPISMALSSGNAGPKSEE